MWEVRLQIVRALPLFAWTAAEMRRVERILIDNVEFPQTFVRAWALDGLSRFALTRPGLMPAVRRHLRLFERSSSKALVARARHIRARIDAKRSTARSHTVERRKGSSTHADSLSRDRHKRR